MAKLFGLSPTSLNTWLTCPRQFKAKYITKEVVFKATPATEYGSYVHTSIENYLKGTADLPADCEYVRGVADWVKRYAARPNVELHVEYKLAARAPWDKANDPHSPSPWRGRGYGGIADVLLIDHDAKRTIIVDWKTGKKAKDDPIQAQMLALCAAADTHHMYRDVTTLWVFVKAGSIVHHRYMVDSLHPVKTTERAMWDWKAAMEADEFPPKPSGLCGKWCDVMACPHNGRSINGGV